LHIHAPYPLNVCREMGEVHPQNRRAGLRAVSRREVAHLETTHPLAVLRIDEAQELRPSQFDRRGRHS
jgi:hypothetical protein